MKFHKYHGLGNDYIVMEPKALIDKLSSEMVRFICHRNYGIGSDGILLGPIPFEDVSFATAADTAQPRPQFCLRIFNPDGSEAEKSGNGLRIFARYLLDTGQVETSAPFTVWTLGGPVVCTVLPDGATIRASMGRVSFRSADIPVAGPERDVLNESIDVDGCRFNFCAATIGNPHCVVLSDDTSPELARRVGPRLETDPRFPNRTNVQFMRVLDRHNIRIEIWERGAGYTLASGSSASASAAVARRLGFCDSPIIVHMPGGELRIDIDNNFGIELTGPVTAVAVGNINVELFTVSADRL